MDAQDVLRVLARWDHGILSAVPIQGGWNSTVWLARAADGRRYVAKLADADSSTSFRSGLRVARRSADRGFRSGPPVPLPDGSLDIAVSGGALALLEYVPGRRAETDSAADLRRVGGALARAHASVAADVECLDPSLVVLRTVHEEVDRARNSPAVEVFVQHVIATDDRVAAVEELCARLSDTPAADLAATPFLLIGTPKEMAAQLRRQADRYGITRYVVREPATEPLEAALALFAG